MGKNTSILPATGSGSKKARASEAEILQLEFLSFIASLIAQALSKNVTLHHADLMMAQHVKLRERLVALKEQN